MVCSINHPSKRDQPLVMMAGRTIRLIAISTTRRSRTTTDRSQQQHTYYFDKNLFHYVLLKLFGYFNMHYDNSSFSLPIAYMSFRLPR